MSERNREKQSTYLRWKRKARAGLCAAGLLMSGCSVPNVPPQPNIETHADPIDEGCIKSAVANQQLLLDTIDQLEESPPGQISDTYPANLSSTIESSSKEEVAVLLESIFPGTTFVIGPNPEWPQFISEMEVEDEDYRAFAYDYLSVMGALSQRAYDAQIPIATVYFWPFAPPEKPGEYRPFGFYQNYWAVDGNEMRKVGTLSFSSVFYEVDGTSLTYTQVIQRGRIGQISHEIVHGVNQAVIDASGLHVGMFTTLECLQPESIPYGAQTPEIKVLLEDQTVVVGFRANDNIPPALHITTDGQRGKEEELSTIAQKYPGAFEGGEDEEGPWPCLDRETLENPRSRLANKIVLLLGRAAEVEPHFLTFINVCSQ